MVLKIRGAQLYANTQFTTVTSVTYIVCLKSHAKFDVYIIIKFIIDTEVQITKPYTILAFADKRSWPKNPDFGLDTNKIER